MNTPLNKNKLIIIVVGLLFFAFATVFADKMPNFGTPKLSTEAKQAIGIVGLDENDLRNTIQQYFPKSSVGDLGKVESTEGVGSPEIDGVKETALVTRIVDGDTIVIDGKTTVRLIGIDTPEKDTTTTDPECWNQEASQKTSDLLLGKTVRLEKDISEVDRYGRLLRYVYLGDVFINEELVRSGDAIAKAYPPDIREKALLTLAQTEAKAEMRGLWGACGKK
ncbi:MAG: hypothetical protein RL641_424 [Candidatus Parcubacteria bacterium]|jgi:micrococcal nuclease